MTDSKKIVSEFEDTFGKLTATERDWLDRQISKANEQLCEEIVAHRRTMWLIVRGRGTCIVEKTEVEDYPGDERAHLRRNEDQETGNLEFCAIVLEDR